MDQSLMKGSTAMLVMKLLDGNDMYGYQMIEELRRRSDHTFDLKAGTLYPLLHSLEQQGFVTAREEDAGQSRPRRYYHLTNSGKAQLKVKEEEWNTYAGAVRRVMEGGASLA